MKRPTYIIIFIALIIGVLTLAQIGVANQISTAGSELSKLQDKLDDYERKNTILQEKVLDASSYSNISEKAKKLGYAKVKSEIVLSAPLPLALNR